jgi:hypothetical protein
MMASATAAVMNMNESGRAAGMAAVLNLIFDI